MGQSVASAASSTQSASRGTSRHRCSWLRKARFEQSTLQYASAHRSQRGRLQTTVPAVLCVAHTDGAVSAVTGETVGENLKDVPDMSELR